MTNGLNSDVNDFNDVLRNHGVGAVRERFDKNRSIPQASGRDKDGALNDGSGKQINDDGSGEASNITAWPVLDKTAAHGLVGEIAKLATRNSEADPNAVMATALAWGAASFGRNRFFRVGDTIHHARLFGALVGASSRARNTAAAVPTLS